MDDRTLFEFYDQRIGTEVVSQKHFDTWWKKAQQKDPELLNFERSFLINDDAEQVSKVGFPEFLASRQFETQIKRINLNQALMRTG